MVSSFPFIALDLCLGLTGAKGWISWGLKVWLYVVSRSIFAELGLYSVCWRSGCRVISWGMKSVLSRERERERGREWEREREREKERERDYRRLQTSSFMISSSVPVCQKVLGRLITWMLLLRPSALYSWHDPGLVLVSCSGVGCRCHSQEICRHTLSAHMCLHSPCHR